MAQNYGGGGYGGSGGYGGGGGGGPPPVPAHVRQSVSQQQQQHQQAPQQRAAPPAAADEGIWKPATDPSSGKTYYYNTKTKVVSWTNPAATSAAANAAPPAAAAASSVATPAATTAAPTHNWKSTTAPDTGRTYYYNTVTRATQYEVPEEILREQEYQQQQQQQQQQSTSASQQQHHHDAYSSPSYAEDTVSSSSAYSHHPSTAANSHSSSFDSQRQRDDTAATSSQYQQQQQQQHAQMSPAYGSAGTGGGPPPRQSTQQSHAAERKTSEPTRMAPKKYPKHDSSNEVLIIPHEENPQYLTKIAGDRASQFQMEKYCQLYFTRHRKGGVMKFSKCSLDEMMSHTTGLIPGPLKKLLPENHKAAVQFWRNITGFMGDRKSTKEVIPHLRKLIHFALEAPEEIHDEIYCQIFKQTTKNPRPTSLLKGWQLMAICLGFFKPSDELACYLAVHFLDNGNAGGEIGQFAKYCLERLERIMKFPQTRKFVPAMVEIEAVQLRKPIEVRVEFLDETYRTIAIDSYTTAKEVFKALIIGLDLSNPRHYTLSALETPTSTEEEEKRRQAYEALYKSKEWLKEHTPDEAMPYEELRERRITPTTRVVDVLGEFEALNRRNQENRKYKISLKKRILLEDSNDPSQMDTDLERKLHFCQIAYDVVQGYYDVTEKMAITLAAIQVQADHGVNDLSFYSSGLISDNLHRYIAKTFRVKRDPIYLAGRIIGEHEQYVELTQQEARDMYLDQVRQFSTFGCSWFVALQTTRTTHAVDTGRQTLIGISSRNLVLLDPLTRAIIGTFPLQDVLTEGFKPDTFVLVVGDLVQQKKFNYRTPHGKELHSLLREYTNIMNFIEDEEQPDEYEFE